MSYNHAISIHYQSNQESLVADAQKGRGLMQKMETKTASMMKFSQQSYIYFVCSHKVLLVMTSKRFKSPFRYVIFLLTQPQVAYQQQKKLWKLCAADAQPLSHFSRTIYSLVAIVIWGVFIHTAVMSHKLSIYQLFYFIYTNLRKSWGQFNKCFFQIRVNFSVILNYITRFKKLIANWI